jgi:hypothetical protein
VWGFDANGCKDDHSVSITVSNCLGLGELTGKTIGIYPNPGTGLFMMKADGLANSEFFVTNSLGEVVLSGIIMDEETKIDLGDKANGVYLITVKGIDGSQGIRVIKQ